MQYWRMSFRYGISAWFSYLTVKLKNKLANMHKTAMKIIGRRDYEPIQSLYDQTIMKQAMKIKSDPQRPSSLNTKPCHQEEDSVYQNLKLIA